VSSIVAKILVMMLQLEDNLWDDFGESDDHIVPHPSDECGDRFAVQSDGCKNPRREVIGFTSNAPNATKLGIRGKEKKDLPILTKKDAMLDKGPWSQTPNGVFPSSRDSDSLKDMASIESDDTRMPSHCFKNGKIDSAGSEFCADDPILDDKCAAVDNNLYRYTLSNISQTHNDLSFLDNDREEKESNDLLSYWWPNIENFEDVDRMFRWSSKSFFLFLIFSCYSPSFLFFSSSSSSSSSSSFLFFFSCLFFFLFVFWVYTAYGSLCN